MGGKRLLAHADNEGHLSGSVDKRRYGWKRVEIGRAHRQTSASPNTAPKSGCEEPLRAATSAPVGLILESVWELSDHAVFRRDKVIRGPVGGAMAWHG
jgi:hypothetical protein